MKGSGSSKSRKHALLLLHKAAQDEYVLDAHLSDVMFPVDIYGFHAQQAVEKLLKAALVIQAGGFPQIHRLEVLIDLLAQACPEVLRFDDLRALTPFAVRLRYDLLPSETTPSLDGPRVRKRIAELRTWVESIIEAAAP
jgi:HEPN domain-containing protein